jgi:hypothetical protein
VKISRSSSTSIHSLDPPIANPLPPLAETPPSPRFRFRVCLNPIIPSRACSWSRALPHTILLRRSLLRIVNPSPEYPISSQRHLSWLLIIILIDAQETFLLREAALWHFLLRGWWIRALGPTGVVVLLNVLHVLLKR